MKTLQTIIAAAMLLAVTTASAFMTPVQSVTRTMMTESASSSEDAHELGMNKLAQLHDCTTAELEQMLDADLGEIESNTLHLVDDGSVSIQERMNIDRQLSYVGVVEVNVSFVPNDSDY